MGQIKGIHHVSMKCCNKKEYEKAIEFYQNVLGLDIARQWNTGIMFETGASFIEIFNNADFRLRKGTVRHFAMARLAKK